MSNGGRKEVMTGIMMRTDWKGQFLVYTEKRGYCTYTLGDKGQEGLKHGWYFARREVHFDLFCEVQ